MIRRIASATEPVAGGPHGISGTVALNPFAPRPQSGPYVPPRLERAIAARWKVWVPWVRYQQVRAPNYDPAVATAEAVRLRQRHSEHIIAMTRDCISMRTIRRHRLDDPRISDDVHALLVEAAKERQSKAWFRRSEEQRKQDRLPTLIRLGPIVRNAATTNPDSGPVEGHAPAVLILDPVSVQVAIQSIRRQVCEHFYLREMRDPELTVRTNRRAYVLPRQIAMYMVRQLTGASLEEIGRQFGGRHHTTVLHSINRIDEMRRLDKALDRTITQLVGAILLHFGVSERKSLSPGESCSSGPQ